MKKIFLIILSLICFQGFVLADDVSDVRTFFNNYVKDANSFSPSILNYYLPNARIIRVVHKKEGGLVSIDFPMSAYADQLKKGEKLAKMVGYSNKYTNINVKKLTNGNYKISAIRTPMKDKTGLPFHFIVTKTNSGYKVAEESMDTTVQKFLNYAK